MATITPNLWMDSNAEEAVDYWTSIFPDSKVISKNYYPAEAPGSVKVGDLMTAEFEIMGQRAIVLNGGPGSFKLDEAFSFVVACEDQSEIDKYWDLLVQGGEPSQCGWLKDRFGVSWQIVPRQLEGLTTDPNPAKAAAAFAAMLQMVKLDLDTLQKAYDNA